MSKKIVFRVDAGSDIGFGHFRRCINLAEMLSHAGYELFIITLKSNPLLKSMSLSMFKEIHLIEGHQKLDAEYLGYFAQKRIASWVVLDGYNFKGDFEKKIKEFNLKLFRIDDLTSAEYHADVLLNQNYGAEKWSFKVGSETKLALGLNYLLLPSTLLSHSIKNPKLRDTKRLKILITLGGATHLYYEKLVVLGEAISELIHDSFDFIIFIPDQKLKDEFESKLKDAKDRIKVLGFCENIYDFFSESDFVLTSPGTTMWELIYLICPFAVLPLTADHEEYCKILAKDKICEVLPRIDQLRKEDLKDLFKDASRKIYRQEFTDKLEKILVRDDMTSKIIKLFD